MQRNYTQVSLDAFYMYIAHCYQRGKNKSVLPMNVRAYAALKNAILKLNPLLILY